jgi:hypothetical protein
MGYHVCTVASITSARLQTDSSFGCGFRIGKRDILSKCQYAIFEEQNEPLGRLMSDTRATCNWEIRLGATSLEVHDAGEK